MTRRDSKWNSRKWKPLQINSFFWFCAGVNRLLLLSCNTEHTKYFCIGATVFFTACFAAISGAYALYFVFSGTPYSVLSAICFGLLWGLTIFNIDRYLVISLKKQNKPIKEFFTALPRILLAIMIGIVIARPLELKIFEKEIKEGLKQYYFENQQQLVKSKNDTFNLQFIDITNQLERKRAEKENAYKNWEDEKVLRDTERIGIKTNRTTGKNGWGTETKKLQIEVEKKQAIYDSLDIQIMRLEDLLTKKRNSAGLNEVTIDNNANLEILVSNAGFYDRNKILGQISSWTPLSLFNMYTEKKPFQTVTQSKRLTAQRFDGENDKTVFFISMLMILIECLPVIIKLMSQRGSYDINVDAKDDKIQYKIRQEKYSYKYFIGELFLRKNDIYDKAVDQWVKTEVSSSELGDKYIIPEFDQK